MHCTLIFVSCTLVYEKTITLEIFFNELSQILIVFIGILNFATLFVYISSLHQKMQCTIRKNAKLLNGMHEGLLILSKFEKSILFVNKPAQKLLTNIIDFSSSSSPQPTAKATPSQLESKPSKKSQSKDLLVVENNQTQHKEQSSQTKLDDEQ